MKTRIRTVLPLTLLATMLAAPVGFAQSTGQGHEHGTKGVQAMHAMDGTATSDTTDVARAHMVDGVQVVDVTIGTDGYSATRIALKAGVPARIAFKRTTDATCAFQIMIPELGVEKTDLPLDEVVPITFTPENDGEYTFACGMNMLKGTLIVRS